MPDRELRDVLDHQHPLEADAFEMCRESFGTMFGALPEFESRACECARELRAFEQRTRGRQQNAYAAPTKFLEGLDPFASDFRVRFHLAESFARRIKRARNIIGQCFDVCQPPLGVRELVGDDNDQTLRERARECRNEHGVARARQAPDAQ
jgi:hypothetical protein